MATEKKSGKTLAKMPKAKSQKRSAERSLAATIGAIVALVLFIVTLIVISIMNRHEMACTSSRGNITISYDQKKVIGYVSTNVEYDYDKQREYAERIGIDQYLDEYEDWFKSNTDDGVYKLKNRRRVLWQQKSQQNQRKLPPKTKVEKVALLLQLSLVLSSSSLQSLQSS